MTVTYSETQHFINSLNEGLDALNKSTGHKTFSHVKDIDELRDGVLLASIIEKFESVCGRKRRVRDRMYFKFIEDWLVTIGNMSYIPNYGSFIKNILKENDVQLIANIFGIVAITMYNNQHEMWQSFNVDIFFLLLGEPLIPKINRILNKKFNIENDERYTVVVQNRQLEHRIEKLSQKFAETVDRFETEAKDRELEIETKLSEMGSQLKEKDNKICELETQISELNKTIESLTQQNLSKNFKIESLKDIMNGTDKTLVSVEELLSLKQKVTSMQSQMKQISTEMETKFNITEVTTDP